MNIKYTDNCDNVNWNEVSDIFNILEWGNRPPNLIKSAFLKSSFVRFAYKDSKLIGMGRTVDDGAFYGWVVDLAILPEYQEKGIGSIILKELETDLKPYLTTMLTAVRGKGGFYEKQGWVKQSDAYIFPRSESQKRNFT